MIEYVLLEVNNRLEDGFLVSSALGRLFPDLQFISDGTKVIFCADEEPDAELLKALRDILGVG